jgi:hypothetical protein
VTNIHFLSEFKEFHDHAYKISKGEEIIWIEFYGLIVLFSLFVISFMRTALTDAGKIPEDEIWNLHIPDNIPVELQSEFLALTVERREEILTQNKNILTDNNINETTCTSGKNIL